MREAFFEYHQQEKLPHLLKEGIIILDTNALLNIYRYDEEIREKYFEILDVVKDRLYLTHQAATEFYKNRLIIINNKVRLKPELEDVLMSNLGKLKNLIETPESFNKEGAKLLKYENRLQAILLETIDNAMDIISSEIDGYAINITETFIHKDKILDEIEKLFEGKINSPFSSEEKKEIYKLGKVRYSNKIPPGYEDAKSKADPECYGDLIIWEEMIKISKEKKSSILFISDDTKEDWYDLLNGKQYKMGPRKELIREFRDRTQMNFYSIPTQKFIKQISSTYNIQNTNELLNATKFIEEETSDEYNKKEEELNFRNIDNMLNNDSYENYNEYNIDCFKIHSTLVVFFKKQIDNHLYDKINRIIDSEYKNQRAINILFDFNGIKLKYSILDDLIRRKIILTIVNHGEIGLCNLSSENQVHFDESRSFSFVNCYSTRSEALIDLEERMNS